MVSHTYIPSTMCGGFTHATFARRITAGLLGCQYKIELATLSLWTAKSVKLNELSYALVHSSAITEAAFIHQLLIIASQKHCPDVHNPLQRDTSDHVKGPTVCNGGIAIATTDSCARCHLYSQL